MVDPRLPLILLRAVQQQDAPAELLPDENPGEAFPHRLGLSGVVEDQIREFERLARRRRAIDEDRVRGLLQLIVRRPDAKSIFNAAGRELAGLRFKGPLGRVRRLTRRLPGQLRRRAVVRGLRAAHGSLLIADSLDLEADPLEMRATDALTARVGANGTACRLYGALAAGLAEFSGAGPLRFDHSHCQARGSSACVWKEARPPTEST